MTVALLAILPAAARASAPREIAPATPTDQWLPSAYLASWGHATVDCPPYSDEAWVFWETYAQAIVGDRWAMFASSRAQCKGAVRVARAVRAKDSFHLGAGFDRRQQETLALLPVSNGAYLLPAAAQAAARAARPGLTCYALPSSYAVGFEHIVGDVGNLTPELEDMGWTQAVGVGASFVICASSPHKQGRRLSASSWFSFGPMANDCAVEYQIKLDRPDPEEPGQMIAPKYYEANLWGDYSQVSCPPA